MKLLKAPVILIIVTVILNSCGGEKGRIDRVVVGIPADIESLNPLYSIDVNEGNITELMFLSLFKHNWDDENGNIQTVPMLAKSWKWSEDKSTLNIVMRDDVYWTDGVNTTAEDVVFSFDVYSDPDVSSSKYGSLNVFYLDEDLHINLDSTFIIHSPYEFDIHFKAGANPSLFDIDFPIVPKHVYENIERENFSTVKENYEPVTNGPYKFGRWERNQIIVLKANENSFLYDADGVDEIIFKIVPDYTSRLTQLKKGEIDIMEDVKTDDAVQFENSEEIIIEPLRGREYEYVGWNNIDPGAFDEERIEPNKFFGNSIVRKALTYAINRKELVEEALLNYGELADGPVTPIFRGLLNKEVESYPYDPAKAKELLASAGWVDIDNDGILEKDNTEFSFVLNIPGGNPRREFVATVIRNNLNAVGINVKVETMELGVLIDALFGKDLNAWLASWFVPIPIDLMSYWYSDLDGTPLNLISYQNSRIDSILEQINSNIPDEERESLYKKFQMIIHKDQPVTFLYWVDNLTAHNTRVKNVDVNPLGIIHDCWNWRIED